MNSRAQYLRSLEREIHAAAKIIDELTRENYELRQMLKFSATNTTPTRHETESKERTAF